MSAERVQAFLTAFAAWAEGEPQIQAVALVGSHARGTAGDTSDVDLVIIADDPARYVHDLGWSHRFGPVAQFQIEPYGKLTSLRVWYDGGLEVEYGFTDVRWIATPLDEGTRQVVSHGLRVLFERDRILTTTLAMHPPAPVRSFDP